MKGVPSDLRGETTLQLPYGRVGRCGVHACRSEFRRGSLPLVRVPVFVSPVQLLSWCMFWMIDPLHHDHTTSGRGKGVPDRGEVDPGGC